VVTVAPNPFNASTSVTLVLPEERDVEITVYDAAGARIARILNERLSAGSHDLHWNGKNDAGTDLGSGIYFLRVNAGDFRSTRKIVLLR
jgi:flagellar hook assembly protein FlgD